jgi:hypothetical protein
VPTLLGRARQFSLFGAKNIQFMAFLPQSMQVDQADSKGFDCVFPVPLTDSDDEEMGAGDDVNEAVPMKFSNSE